MITDLRFISRDGKRILQMKRNCKDFSKRTVVEEWQDVPIVEEENDDNRR